MSAGDRSCLQASGSTARRRVHQHCTHYAILMPFQFPRLQNTQSISCPSLWGCLHRIRTGQPQPAPTLQGAVRERGTQKHRRTSPALGGFTSQPHSAPMRQTAPKGSPGSTQHQTGQTRHLLTRVTGHNGAGSHHVASNLLASSKQTALVN